MEKSVKTLHEFIGLPEYINVFLFAISLIAILGPYFEGQEVGEYKFPKFKSPTTKKRLKFLGPLVLIINIIYYAPFLDPKTTVLADDPFECAPAIPSFTRKIDTPLNMTAIERGQGTWRSVSLLNKEQSPKTGFYLETGNFVRPTTKSDIAAVPLRPKKGTYTVRADFLLSPEKTNVADAYFCVGFFKINLENGEYPRPDADLAYLWNPKVTVIQLLVNGSGEWQINAAPSRGNATSTNSTQLVEVPRRDRYVSLQDGRVFSLALSWNVDRNTVSGQFNGSILFQDISVADRGISKTDVTCVGFGSDSYPGRNSHVSAFRVTCSK